MEALNWIFPSAYPALEKAPFMVVGMHPRVDDVSAFGSAGFPMF